MAYALIENEHFTLTLIFHINEPGGLILEEVGKSEKETIGQPQNRALSSDMRIQKYEKGTVNELIYVLRHKEKKLLDAFSSQLNRKMTPTAMRVIKDTKLKNLSRFSIAQN